MTYNHIEVERRGRIALIRLNRPRYRNAQSRVMLDEMTTAFAELDLDSSVKVIILAGNGEHFSAGHDLGTPEEVADEQERPFGESAIGRINRSWHLYIEDSLRWRDVKKPTIAAVQGYCIYGGFLIASCMDIIIAADNAQFLPAHLQLFTAPWDLGIRNAKKILYENRFIPADEARELGLVSDVVPAEELEATAIAQAERWAESSLLTLRMLKQSINGAQDAMGYRTALHSAHSNYMMLELAEAASGKKREGRRMTGVKEALTKDAGEGKS